MIHCSAGIACACLSGIACATFVHRPYCSSLPSDRRTPPAAALRRHAAGHKGSREARRARQPACDAGTGDHHHDRAMRVIMRMHAVVCCTFLCCVGTERLCVGQACIEDASLVAGRRGKQVIDLVCNEVGSLPPDSLVPLIVTAHPGSSLSSCNELIFFATPNRSST